MLALLFKTILNCNYSLTFKHNFLSTLQYAYS